MNTNYSTTSMLDMVFENRNKSYGAYQLRQSQGRSLQFAMLFMVSAVFAFGFGNYLKSRLSKPTATSIASHEIFNVSEVEIVQPPKIDPPKPKQDIMPTQTQENREKQIVRNDELRSDTIIPNKELVAESGLTTNLSNNTNPLGRTDGKGTELTEEPVEIFEVAKTTEPKNWVDEMPQFEGGEAALLKWLSKETSYPGSERDLGVEGKALIRFVVNEDGSVSNPSIIRSDSPGFGKEGLRVVKRLPNFKPGRQHGDPVKVWYVLPFQFSLDH